MKKIPSFARRTCVLTFLVAGLLATFSPAACHLLTTEHADLRVTFTAEASRPFGLVVYDHEGNAARRTNEVTIVGGAAARLTLPPGTPFGEGGSSIWILPQNQNALLPYLGTSGVGVPASAVADNQLMIRLVRVEGPGHFLMWQTLGPGQFDIQMDSRDGINAADVEYLLVDGHEHHSWGFTTSGVYRVTFQAGGTLAGQTQPSWGAEHTFLFHLLPLRPWENWQATNWPCQCNPQLIGPGADPDGDGMVNAAEYAQGTHPSLADGWRRPWATVVWHNGVAYGALVFQRAKAATDVLWLPSASSRLTPISWETMSQIHQLDDQGETERLTIRDSQPLSQSPHRWYQLRFQVVP